MASRKLEHLNERVQHKLGMILERETHDPRFRHVTVTSVRLSKDLSHARVTFTTHDALMPKASRAAGPKATAPKGPKAAGSQGPKGAAPKGAKPKAPKRPKGAGDIASLTKALNGAAGFFSQALARTLETRISPRVTFVFDPSLDYLQNMENVLKPLRASGEMGDPDRPTGAEAAGEPSVAADEESAQGKEASGSGAAPHREAP